MADSEIVEQASPEGVDVNTEAPKKDEKKNNKNKNKNNKSKLVPPFVTLLAAFITCIFSIVENVSFGLFTKRLLVVVIIFLILGTIIKMVYDKATITLEEEEKPEGEFEIEENANLEDVSMPNFDEDDEEE